MVVAIFSLFSQIGTMVLLISPQRIERESCAGAEIEALEERNRWLYSDDARAIGICQREGETRRTRSYTTVMVIAIFRRFSSPAGAKDLSIITRLKSKRT